MTGQHAGHTRVRDNFGRVGGVGPQRRVPLEPEDVTVAEVLKQAGYATGITGKWGLGEPETAGVPNRQGFDAWLGFLNQRRAHTYYPDYIWKNQQKLILEGNAGGQRTTVERPVRARIAAQPATPQGPPSQATVGKERQSPQRPQRRCGEFGVECARRVAHGFSVAANVGSTRF